MNADQEQEWRDLLAFDACAPGCTDATACNYDEAATDDDGLCGCGFDDLSGKSLEGADGRLSRSLHCDGNVLDEWRDVA